MSEGFFTTRTERIAAELRALYDSFGYRPYKMSKFEEYELYAGNKEFLVSDSVITFTDTDGRLMALKPDVTLSIIKNTDVERAETGRAEGGQTPVPQVSGTANNAGPQVSATANTADPQGTMPLRKLYYSENVYRVAGGAGGNSGGGTFREIMQTGLECIGDVDEYCLAEVLLLAAKSLAAAGAEYVLDVGQLDLLFAAVDRVSGDPAVQEALIECVRGKNLHGIRELAAAQGTDARALEALTALYGPADEVLAEVGRVAAELGMEAEFGQFRNVLGALANTAAGAGVRVDFSVVSDRNYYNGIAFKGYVRGVPERVLSGGQYDRLMEKLSKPGRAIGFAVYMDALERLPAAGTDGDNALLIFDDGNDTAALLEKVDRLTAEGRRVRVERGTDPDSPAQGCGTGTDLDSPESGTGTDPDAPAPGGDTASGINGFGLLIGARDDMLNIALPKGRLGEKVYKMLEKAGYPCPEVLENSRKLVFENPAARVRYFWVKPSDVAIYVERGAADLGVAGRDILLEYAPDVYELCDLKTGICRMAVAAPEGFRDTHAGTLRVATKFARIARNYYAGTGREIDIIHLNGSIELAPVLGLSDVIVDIVETGTTLRENRLAVIDTVLPISARLVANKASCKFKNAPIRQLVADTQRIVESAQQ